jgi:hypothetical protein
VFGRAHLLALRPRPMAVVGGLAVTSAIVRFAVATQVRTPLLYPDEYIHTALARSIPDGTFPHIRGGSVAFFSYLAPLFMSPAWLIGDVHLSYRAAQLLGCIAFSTAAFPVYVLARRLGVNAYPAIGAVLLALVIPDGVWASHLLAEPYAYPLFLLGVLVGVDAIARPTTRRQLGLISISLALPLLGGAQFFVFGVAYLPASYLAGPRSLGAYFRRQRVVLAAIGLGAMVAAADIVATGSGRIAHVYETATISFHYPIVGSVTWFGVNVFVFAIAAGWVVVPGALIGLRAMLATKDGAERPFAFFASFLIVGQLLEATPFGVNANSVLERYAFYGAPLVGVAFAYAAGRRLLNHRAHAILASVAAATGLLLPVSSPLLGRTIDESPTLLGLSQFDLGGLGAASVWAPALAALGIVALWRTGHRVLPVIAIAICFAITSAASWSLVRASRRLEVARVDAPDGTALVTWAGADASELLQTLFWNRGISRVLVVDPGISPDGFPFVPVKLAHGPRIVSTGAAPLPGPFVFGPDVLVFVGAHQIGGRGVLATSTRAPSVLVFGWNRRTGRLDRGGWINTAGARRPMSLVLRLRAVDGSPKTLSIQCEGGMAWSVPVGEKAAPIVIPIPTAQARACRFVFVRGSFRLGRAASVVGRLTVRERGG